MKNIMALFFVLMFAMVGCSGPSTDVVFLSKAALSSKVSSSNFTKKDECWASWTTVTKIEHNGTALSGDVTYPASPARYADFSKRTEDEVSTTEKCNQVAADQKSKLTPEQFSMVATESIVVDTKFGHVKRFPASK